MQGIAFCIAHGISVFEGGAQGEHKLSRGLLPVRTYSAHWIADERFAQAIDNSLDHATPAVDSSLDELQAHSPFKYGFLLFSLWAALGSTETPRTYCELDLALGIAFDLKNFSFDP